MKPQNKQTFAQRAKKLDKIYSNRANDKMLENEYNELMESLIDEQEAVRTQMGLVNDGNQDRIAPEQFDGLNANGQFLPIGASRRNKIQDWNLPAKGMEYLGEQYNELAPDWLKTGVGAVGDAINYIDTGGGVLKGSNSPLLNTGVAPVAGIAGRAEQAFQPSIGRISRSLASDKTAKEAKLLDELANAPGSLGKQYPSGVPDPYNSAINAALIAKRANKLKNAGQITSQNNTPWDMITMGAGLTGTGALGYGLSKAGAFDNTKNNTQPSTQPVGGSNIVSNANTIQKQIPNTSRNPFRYTEESTEMFPPDINEKFTVNNPPINEKVRITPTTNTINNAVNNTSTNLKPQSNNDYSYRDATDMDTKRITPLNTNESSVIGNSPFMSNNSMLQTSKLIENAENIKNKKINGNKSGNSDLTNSYISAGASALNNILQGVLTKKPKEISAPTYTPKELNLYDAELEAKRQAEVGSNIARNQARNLGLNAGATIANQSAAQSDIDRRLASALTDINLEEQKYNVGEQNKAGILNAETKFKNDLVNKQLKDQYDQKMLDSLSGTIGVIPELMTDINKIKTQNKQFKDMTDSEKEKYMIYANLFKYGVLGDNFDIRNLSNIGYTGGKRK